MDRECPEFRHDAINKCSEATSPLSLVLNITINLVRNEVRTNAVPNFERCLAVRHTSPYLDNFSRRVRAWYNAFRATERVFIVYNDEIAILEGHGMDLDEDFVLFQRRDDGFSSFQSIHSGFLFVASSEQAEALRIVGHVLI